jgi:hypothetical protein
MNKLLPFVFICLMTPCTPILAEDNDALSIVASGFAAFQKNGQLAAIDSWLAGSARETDDDFQDQVAARMNRVQRFLGRNVGFETVRAVRLTLSTERIYVAVKFEKGAAWMSFDCFKSEKNWIITRLAFETNATLILPANILGGQ